MPIVDGLTATKMIRSFEKTDPAHLLTQRASLNGRVPIIAVSASLIEKERQQYIDAGFDGWILKPISFPRLNELMTGIIDQKVREEALYISGQWERGGWFEKAQPDVFDASTTPQERVPFSGPSNEVQEAAKDTNNPTAGARSGARQDREQIRMLGEQKREREAHHSSVDGEERKEGFTGIPEVASPQAMDT